MYFINIFYYYTFREVTKARILLRKHGILGSILVGKTRKKTHEIKQNGMLHINESRQRRRCMRCIRKLNFAVHFFNTSAIKEAYQ